MEFGSFSAVDHLNQHSNQHFNLPQICCSNCGTNFEELNLMQILMDHIKPSIGEEVEKVFNRVILPYMQLLLQNSVLPPISSSLPHQAEPSVSSSLQLRFNGIIPDELFTMTKIEESGSLEVELVDEFGKRVEVGPESGVSIKIDVLDGDFDVEDKCDWTENDYNSNIAKPRDTKGALLKGLRKSKTVMSRGVADVSHISITDNSSTRVNKNFRLGAKVVEGLPPGVVVKAAVSKAFRVKERRVKSGRKNADVSLKDDIWRLVYIRKHSDAHKNALRAGIYTVKDFLQFYHSDPIEMKRILDVPEAKWSEIVKNAEACKLTNERYEYSDATSGEVLVLDCAFNIISVTLGGQINQPYKYDDLDDSQKEQADQLRRSAYEKRNELKYHAPMKQISHHNPIYPSCMQGQEPPPPPPPSSVDFVVGGLSESLGTGHVTSNYMHINSTMNIQYLDARAAHQVNLMENATACMATPMLNSFPHEDAEQPEASLQDTDWDQVLQELLDNTPQQEERGNVSQVSAHNHVISKVKAACYVTKAAFLFKISIQQSPRAQNKKRRLQ